MEDWRPVNSDGKAWFEYAPPYTATDRILEDLRKTETDLETQLEYVRYQIDMAENGDVF